jgi:hypothetical protein
MGYKMLVTLAAAAVSVGAAAQAPEAHSAPPVRTRAEVCSLLHRLAQGPDPFMEKTKASQDASKRTSKIARAVHNEVCVKSKGAPDAPMTPDGVQYFGQTANGQADGEGAMFYADGARYIGALKGGVRQGEGFVIRPDGARYVGLWDKDKPHGKGLLQYRETIDVKVDDPNKAK